MDEYPPAKINAHMAIMKGMDKKQEEERRKAEQQS